MDFILTIIYFALILSIVVSIHEFGHFLFAKKAGIYVYEFSIGMGPRLFKFNRKNDETEYSIRLLPIGGYVQMAGESVEEDKNIPKEKNMQNKTWIQRFMVVIAGILFNFILALIIFFIVGLINGVPNNKPYVVNITEGTPAYTSGLRDGDLITSINGVKINNSDRLLIEMQVALGETIDLNIKDTTGKIKEIKITPEKIVNGEDVTYKYGFSLNNEIEKGLFASIKYAFERFFGLIGQMLITIWYLIIGKLSLSNLSGPIGIFSVVEQSAQAGFMNIIYLTGYLSLNVGFMNLLPIPALDGGRLLFLIIEKIKRKPVSPKVENIIHNVGFTLLMILIIFVSCNDVLRLFK